MTAMTFEEYIDGPDLEEVVQAMTDRCRKIWRASSGLWDDRGLGGCAPESEVTKERRFKC